MSMPHREQKLVWTFIGIVAALLAIGLGFAIVQLRRSVNSRGDEKTRALITQAKAHRTEPEFLELTDEAVKAMRLKSVVATAPSFSKILHLRGALSIDSNRLSHVHSRFPGQIKELATLKGLGSQQPYPSVSSARELQNFDEVTAGIPLAVIWSKDLGEKKSQLASALAQLRTDETILKNYKDLVKGGNIAEQEVLQQKLKVEQDKIDVASAEYTLRTYQVASDEVTNVKNAAERIHQGLESDKSYAEEWSRVVVTAPITGTIVNKNVVVGDIVDANQELFQIADLTVLAVYLHPYEEDLQSLEQLPKPLQVAINVPAFPELGALQCDVDRFSPMIDPNEHMALFIGRVKNPNRKLKVNQFVTADVGIPAESGVVEIPSNAVIDFGAEAIAFVQPDLKQPRFHRRRIEIVRRYFDVVYVRSELTPEQQEEGLNPIRVGELVVSGGILELEDFLRQQQ